MGSHQAHTGIRVFLTIHVNTAVIDIIHRTAFRTHHI